MNTQNGYYRGGKSKLESLFSLEQNLKMITPGLKMKVTFAFDTYNENFVTRGKEPDYYSVAKSRNDEGELVHSILSYGSEFLDHSSNANYGNQSTYLEAAVTYNRTLTNMRSMRFSYTTSVAMTGVMYNLIVHKVSPVVFLILSTAVISVNLISVTTVRRTLQKASASVSSLP